MSNYYKTSAGLYGSWFAAVYDVVASPLRWLRRRVARLANVSPGMRVLDVATGTGAQARAFGRVGATVVGVDLSPRMLAIAQRKNENANISFLEADATSLPMPDESFDVACVSLALHEMPPSVRTRAAAEGSNGGGIRVSRRGEHQLLLGKLPIESIARRLVAPFAQGAGEEAVKEAQRVLDDVKRAHFERDTDGPTEAP